MLIIPAIDLWEGNVVRFVRGNPLSSRVYSSHPLEVAQRWCAEGAELLHVVDLSAALAKGDNLSVIEELLEKIKIKIEVGGGIRDKLKAKRLISLGAERIVIGTKSLDEIFLEELIDLVGSQRIAVSIDAIGQRVAIEGWQKKSHLKPLEFIQSLIGRGVKWIIYTDISGDGTLRGANLTPIRDFTDYKGFNLIVSGGVSCLDDIVKIRKELPFVYGVIVGKALYENKIGLKEAITVLKAYS